MSRIIFLDTETCGFVGPAVTIQYAYDEHEVNVHHIWEETAEKTLSLIESFLPYTICAFNLTFDWFHLIKIYNILRLLPAEEKPDPQEAFRVEQTALFNGVCLRPVSALDLMLVGKKGKYQITMERKPVIIKNVPNETVEHLKQRLEEKTNLPDILFTKAPMEWECDTEKSKKGFTHLRLRTRTDGKLKTIIKALGGSNVDSEAASTIGHAEELPYRPYGGTWPYHIKRHIQYWMFNARAQRYAKADVAYLRVLYQDLNCPEPNDIDSQLAICVACSRHRGIALDHTKVPIVVNKAKESLVAPTAPAAARRFIEQETKIPIPDTDKTTLQRLATEGIVSAQAVIDARKGQKLIELMDKVQRINRFYPDFIIIGARSGRMSGSGGINPQGIQKKKDIRSIFLFHDADLPYACGGDFSSFEPSIQAAVWDSPSLTKAIQSGRKIYDILGDFLLAQGVDTPYKKLKNAFLAWTYGSYEEKLAKTLDVDIEVAEEVFASLVNAHPEIKAAKQRIIDMFGTMKQRRLGEAVEWKDPVDYIETLFGFKRFFTVENTIAKMLYDLASTLDIEDYTPVYRTQRQQTAGGATRSALYASAFSIQASNIRQAANHEIQGSGAHITKDLQLRLWNLQPVGVYPYYIQVFNFHDEVICSTVEQLKDKTSQIAKEVCDDYKEKIPLIELNWKIGLKNWGELL